MTAPQGACLSGPEVFVRIETRSPCGVEADGERGRELLRDFAFGFGTADVANAFHRPRITTNPQ